MPSVPLDINQQMQRQRIFKAMAESCGEKTFSATTIADIVGRASISRATFYKHFANKHECFYATVDAFLEELQSVAAEVHAHDNGSHPDAIRMVVTAVIEHLASKPDHAKLLLVEATVIDPEIVWRYRGLVLNALATRQQNAGEREGVGSDPEMAFGSAMVLVASHLGAIPAENLASLLPELIYIALRPYDGQQTALAQARLSQ